MLRGSGARPGWRLLLLYDSMYGMDIQRKTKRQSWALVALAAGVLAWIAWKLAPYVPWSL